MSHLASTAPSPFPCKRQRSRIYSPFQLPLRAPALSCLTTVRGRILGLVLINPHLRLIPSNSEIPKFSPHNAIVGSIIEVLYKVWRQIKDLRGLNICSTASRPAGRNNTVATSSDNIGNILSWEVKNAIFFKEEKLKTLKKMKTLTLAKNI